MLVVPLAMAPFLPFQSGEPGLMDRGGWEAQAL